MTTKAFAFDDLPWTHDWNFTVLGQFGDPDEGPSHGCVTTIKASSDTEAEQRVLTYLANNFDDDLRGAVADSEGPASPDHYKVRVTWTRR